MGAALSLAPGADALEAPAREPREPRARSLATLAEQGASMRMLNLLAVARADRDGAAGRPFFQDPTLNSAILVRHRPRADEAYLLERPGPSVTKIIIPLVRTDLAQGGRALLVGERGWRETLIAGTARPGLVRADIALLELLDTLPSFDPFYLRGALSQAAHTPADAYFALSMGDARAMRSFVAGRLAPLVARAGAGRAESQEAGDLRLAAALLVADHARLEPLRRALGLDGEAFRRSAFSWRGYFYYAFTLGRLARDVARISERLRAVRVTGRAEAWPAGEVRARIAAEVRLAGQACRAALTPYDAAFARLLARREPGPLKAVLDRGPEVFARLGERIGGLADAAAYWRHRLEGAEALALSEADADALLADLGPAPAADLTP